MKKGIPKPIKKFKKHQANSKIKNNINDKQFKSKNKLINKNDRNQESYEQQIDKNNNSEQINWKQQNDQENVEEAADNINVEDQQQSQQIQVQDKDIDDQEREENDEGNSNQQEQNHVQNEGELDLLAQNQRNLYQYQEQIGKTGVVYMSRVPPYMTPNFIRKLLNSYDIRRIFLLPQSQWNRKNRIKRGGSKRICFRQGWIEFADKRVAKMAVLTLNGQKMVHKKGSFYCEDIWNLKYLPKFKWHNLTEKLAHQQRIKKQKLRMQMQQQRKVQQYYTTQIHKSKAIKGIIKQKLAKGKNLKENSHRSYGQTSAISQQMD